MDAHLTFPEEYHGLLALITEPVGDDILVATPALEPIIITVYTFLLSVKCCHLASAIFYSYQSS